MNYIFPIGGLGKRTRKLGRHKAFIDINGRPLFEYTLDKIQFKQKDTVTFIGAKKTVPNNGRNLFFDYFKRRDLDLSLEFIVLDKVQPGPALTVLEGLNHSTLPFNDNVHIINIDQQIIYEYHKISKDDGMMPLWFNDKGSSCYAEVQLKDIHSSITRIKEKEMISTLASSGVYIFGSKSLLVKCLRWGYERPEIWKNSKGYDYKELFIGPCMNYIIHSGNNVFPTTTYQKIDLGSTSQIKKFKKIGL